MAKKGGRPSKFETEIRPRFPEIQEWLKLGMTDKDIAENLGISKQTICEYKKKFPEFSELCKNSRKQPVTEIKTALFNRATGFHYSEKKTVVEYEEWSEEVKSALQAIGIDTSNLEKRKLVRMEVYDKYSVPDPASALILLKHWDKEHEWTQDPQMLDLKRKELALREKKIESEEW